MNAQLLRQYAVPILLVLLIIGIGAAGYFYNQVRELRADPQAEGREEARSLIEKVGRHIVLPTDEEPTVATVTDPEKLKDQPFFAKAKAGDKVLLYPKAARAYLYDPESDKLLEVAPLTGGGSAGLESETSDE